MLTNEREPCGALQRSHAVKQKQKEAEHRTMAISKDTERIRARNAAMRQRPIEEKLKIR